MITHSGSTGNGSTGAGLPAGGGLPFRLPLRGPRPAHSTLTARLDDRSARIRHACSSRDSLSDPLDEALARRLIRVKNGKGRFVEGQVGLDRHEAAAGDLPPSRPGGPVTINS